MASKTFSGQLDQAMNEAAAEGNKILFIPQQTVGEVLPGAASELVVESDGTYSIKLAYNTYSIYHYSDVTKRKTLLATDIVVSTDTSVTTIPDLLGSVVPVTEDSVLTIQGYLDEANEAKTDAEAAQAATEALFNNFDSSVADSMALTHTDTPSLSVPFNESGRLDYGIGTEYVSGLPVYGVDFTRSTSCYYVNKSGLIDFADVDEVAVGSDGALLHSAVTGLFPYSNNIGASAWTKTNVTVEDDGTIAPYYSSLTGTTAYHIVNDTSTNTIHRINYGTTISEGWATACAIVKPDTGYESVRLSIVGTDNTKTVVFNTATLSFDGIENAPEDYGYYSLSDGWFMVYMKFYDDTGTTNPNYLFFLPTGTTSNIFTGDGVNGGYVAYFQKFNENIDPRLLCVTSGSSSTITATSCAVPVEGNLPAAGESFTIVCDSYVDGSSTSANYSTYYTVGSNSAGYVGLSQSRSGVIRVQHSLGDWIATNASTTGDVSRLTVTCEPDSASEATTLSLYQDGDLLFSQSFSGFLDDIISSEIKFGANGAGATALNQQIKNLKILPYAASADEIASWGAPK